MEDNPMPTMLERKQDVPATGRKFTPATTGSGYQRPGRSYLLLAILLHAALVAIAALWVPKLDPQPERTRAATPDRPRPAVYQPKKHPAFRFVSKGRMGCGVGPHYPLPEPVPFVSLGYPDSLTHDNLGNAAIRRESGRRSFSIRCGAPDA